MTSFSLLLFTLLACGPADPHDDHHEGEHHEGEHHDEHGPKVVELSPEAIQAARIVVAPATEGTLVQELNLPARVTLDPRKEAIVSAWISGQIDTIAVSPGDTVKKNQALAKVQSPDLGDAVAAFRTAKARDDAADARLERLQRLEADGVSSRAQVLEAEADHAEAEGALEAAEERLRILGIPLQVGDPHKGEHFPSRVPVRTPISGTVLKTDVSVGERVEPGHELFHVGDLDEVWLMIDVFERDLSAVQPGQSVRFGVEAWPGQVFEGDVAQVGDWVEPEARTVEVRVVVDNPEHRLKPNMYATANLSLEESSSLRGIVLPSSAVQPLDGSPVVFVETTPGHFTPRRVQVAEQNSQRVLLQAGLTAGESVVTEGAFTLRSEIEKSELGDGDAH